MCTFNKNNNNNLLKNNNNNNNNSSNELLVPQIFYRYKTYRGGTRRIQEHLRKVTRTYKYRHAKTLLSDRFKVFQFH